MANVFEDIASRAEEMAIDMLYTQIQENNPNVLEHFDSSTFSDTPLHFAAAAGNISLAIEIMRLKPSFALKLNQQGLSPIHVALVNNRIQLVRCIVTINKDLVRVKGKGGLTPLHFVCQAEENYTNISLLIKFLDTCPDSIEDVNVRGETALHIAVINGKFRAFRVLVCWLRKNHRKGAAHLERSILNKMDNDGNTILHILAQLTTQEGQEATNILLRRSKRLYKNVRNSQQNTPLDLATDPAIQGILRNAGARLSGAVPDVNYEQNLISGITLIQDQMIRWYRLGNDVSSEDRSIIMVVASLLVTAVYQSTINPPGGVYPADNGLNTTSTVNSTTTSARHGKPGTSILGPAVFSLLTLFHSEVLFITISTILILMPKRTPFRLLFPLIFGFVGSYIMSGWLLSPNFAGSIIHAVLACILILSFVGVLLYRYTSIRGCMVKT